ncbi:hypothetical protein SELMODRAFT_413965 [Selaginella moellendorffii]|uniref:Terpene synthase n=1 Tax=Selaginella moellendorffii TaxID=88036 RepID=D8RR72_SELML|nr:hypothetical protein SELMODRAFT_413965 [Selaginella moellendorffii]
MFEDVMLSIQSLMDPPLFARYMICLRNYLDALVEDSSLRFAKSIPSLTKHQLLRKQLEALYRDKHYSYLCVIFCHDNASFQGTVDKACEMIQETEGEILQLQKKLMKLGEETGNKDLVEYARYPCVASRNLRWSYVTRTSSREPFHATWFLLPEVTLIVPFGSKCGDHPFAITENHLV